MTVVLPLSVMAEKYPFMSWVAPLVPGGTRPIPCSAERVAMRLDITCTAFAGAPTTGESRILVSDASAATWVVASRVAGSAVRAVVASVADASPTGSDGCGVVVATDPNASGVLVQAPSTATAKKTHTAANRFAIVSCPKSSLFAYRGALAHDQVETMAREGFWSALGGQVGLAQCHRCVCVSVHDDHVGKQGHIRLDFFGIAGIEHRRIHP